LNDLQSAVSARPGIAPDLKHQIHATQHAQTAEVSGLF
jgi:hypothetical protein